MELHISEQDKSKEREWKLDFQMSDAALITTTSVVFAAIAGVLICKVFGSKK